MHFKKKPGQVMLDGKKLYAAIEALKGIRNMTWAEVSEDSDVNFISIKRLRAGRSVEATTYLRLVLWLGERAARKYTYIQE
jgi:hypothetical protein